MQEFGVRLALGATSNDLKILIVKRGLILALIGLVVGFVGTAVFSRSIRSMLFETSRTDPWVGAVVAAIVILCAMLASLIPAQRAGGADIATLLRME